MARVDFPEPEFPRIATRIDSGFGRSSEMICLWLYGDPLRSLGATMADSESDPKLELPPEVLIFDPAVP